MTSEVQISRAEISDLDGAEALYDEVCGYLADKPYNPGWRKGCFPTRENARYFIENEAMYVARIDGEIVGSVSLTYNPSADVDQQSGDSEAEKRDSLSPYICGSSGPAPQRNRLQITRICRYIRREGACKISAAVCVGA